MDALEHADEKFCAMRKRKVMMNLVHLLWMKTKYWLICTVRENNW